MDAPTEPTFGALAMIVRAAKERHLAAITAAENAQDEQAAAHKALQTAIDEIDRFVDAACEP